ncbi:MAG: hypothetical protein ABSA93_36335 [Streptosporangiaceae bacterium]|jgi:hypothetical protein
MSRVVILEYFGSRDLAPAQVRDLVAEATGLTFEFRRSDYIGEYFMSGSPGGHAVVTVRPNEIEDEDGKFQQWDEFADFTTIVEAKQVLTAEGEEPEFIGNLHQKLAEAVGLEFLRRSEPKPR